MLFTLREWGVDTPQPVEADTPVDRDSGEPFIEFAFWTGPRPDRQRVAGARRQCESTVGVYL